MWSQVSDIYTSNLGDYRLKVRLEPDTSMLGLEPELGSSEHPFVWRFEVEHVEEGFVCRGLRETLSEAKQHALAKVSYELPDVLEEAAGF